MLYIIQVRLYVHHNISYLGTFEQLVDWIPLVPRELLKQARIDSRQLWTSQRRDNTTNGSLQTADELSNVQEIASDLSDSLKSEASQVIPTQQIGAPEKSSSEILNLDSSKVVGLVVQVASNAQELGVDGSSVDGVCQKVWNSVRRRERAAVELVWNPLMTKRCSVAAILTLDTEPGLNVLVGQNPRRILLRVVGHESEDEGECGCTE